MKLNEYKLTHTKQQQPERYILLRFMVIKTIVFVLWWQMRLLLFSLKIIGNQYFIQKQNWDFNRRLIKIMLIVFPSEKFDNCLISIFVKVVARFSSFPNNLNTNVL